MPKHHGVYKNLRGRTWQRCAIALGGNVGQVPETFKQALACFDGQHTEVLAVSSLYLSEPLQLPQGVERPTSSDDARDLYTNAACLVRTLLGPRQLLRHLQDIENLFGRVRSRLWAPRTLDLDLVTYGGRSMHERRLILPHPGIAFRSFVLLPLADVAMQRPWPACDLTISDVMPVPCDRAYGIVHKQLRWAVF